MKILKVILLPFVLLQFSGCTNNTIDYHLISTYQDHSVPELEIAISDSTRVLVVVPHADDETVAAGLITLLKNRGASIHLLMLCEHNETRIDELDCSASKLGIEKVEIAGFFNNKWDDIMQNNITFWYEHQDSIKNVIAAKIQSYKPHILITFDAEIGAYGHPEHRISAELTETIFNENKDNPDFAPEKIFQITLSEKLEKFLVSKSPAYALSIGLTGSQGLPGPDVSIDITSYWETKNAAAQCHQTQMGSLRRFHIVYDDDNKDEHINAFSKEYYRVVKR